MKLALLLLSSLLIGACAAPALHQADSWPGGNDDDLRKSGSRRDSIEAGQPEPQLPR